MRLLISLIALRRSRHLGRQLHEIERRVHTLSRHQLARLGTLTLREIGQATKCDFPHLYGTPPEYRYIPWGQGTEIGYTRARSDNAEVCIRGVALWLAVAYHETKDAPQTTLQALYRHLMRLLRELKESGGNKSSATESWLNETAAA